MKYLYNTFNDFGDVYAANDLVELEQVQFQKSEPEPPPSGLFNPLSALESKLIYHNYDALKNPLEVSKADGTRICYVWGYHGTKPIAKIVNASYADFTPAQLTAINTAIADSDADVNSSTENTLRSSLTALRNAIPDAQVTTYTYDYFKGTTSVTDPRGHSIYYFYDSNNRLKRTEDFEGNLLEQYQYNYRN